MLHCSGVGGVAVLLIYCSSLTNLPSFLLQLESHYRMTFTDPESARVPLLVAGHRILNAVSYNPHCSRLPHDPLPPS